MIPATPLLQLNSLNRANKNMRIFIPPFSRIRRRCLLRMLRQFRRILPSPRGREFSILTAAVDATERAEVGQSGQR